MKRQEIYDVINEVFQDVFDDEDISVGDDTKASDIKDWDSLTHITLISAIEDEFDFKFEMKDVLGLANVGMMVDVIEREI